MAVKHVLTIVLTIALCLVPVNGDPSSTVITVAGISYDIVRLGLKIKDIVDKFESDETPENEQLIEVITELSTRIDASSTNILIKVVLQSKLDRIDDAVINIHSSLIDLKNVLEAKTKFEREEFKRLFVSRFEEHDVIKHLRFLPELLEYTIPGTTDKLVHLFAENTRCNMTALFEFKLFYTNLLSDGISLEMLHLRYATNVSLNTTLKKWSDQLNKIIVIFDTQQRTCMNKFPNNVKEDIQAASDALKCWTSSKERYTWKTCDVMFLKPYGTFQFLYFKYASDHLFWYRSDMNKITIFSDTNQTKPDSSILSSAKEKLKSSIQGKEDKNAAKNVGIAIENHLKNQGYSIKALVVFFDEEGISSENLVFDEDSPVLEVSIEDVQLRYCYESGFKCTIPWFGSTKNVKGQMKAYLYSVNDSSVGPYTEISHKTGSSSRNDANTLLFILLISFSIQIFNTIKTDNG